MNISTDEGSTVSFSAPFLVIGMGSGVELRFPVTDNPRLARGTERELTNIEVSPFGLHWPDLDEDLSFEGLLRGDLGQKLL